MLEAVEERDPTIIISLQQSQRNRPQSSEELLTLEPEQALSLSLSLVRSRFALSLSCFRPEKVREGERAMSQESFIYSFIARGTVILAEYTEFTGNFPAIAAQCLQKLPSSNNKFTYSCDHHTFNFLVEDGYGKISLEFFFISLVFYAVEVELLE